MGEQATPTSSADQSGQWLTRDRDSGRDAAERAALVRMLADIRDRVLDAAQLRPGHHVLDFGAGTGLLTHGAVPLVAPTGRVIAVDQSITALADITKQATRCDTVTGDACHLPIATASMDRVVARSVLIYLHDLPAALREIARVLKPAGVFCAFEPVNARRHHDGVLSGLTEAEVQEIDELRHRSSSRSAPMMAFGSDTLIDAATQAGFAISIDETSVTDRIATHDQVDGYLHRRPHPGAANPIELVSQHLGSDLATRYAAAWHQALDQKATAGGITFTTPALYLTASMPRS